MVKDYITILVGTSQRIHRQYIRYESALDNTLIGIEHLNSGYLTNRILDPKILAKYLEAIEDDLEETAPEFESVFMNVYQYYGNSLALFTNIIDELLLELPILIKLKVQVPMSLFSIEMAPVPLDAETYLGEKREYTQIIPETELIALTENNYIPLTQAQISLCAKIGYMYYCEYAHLLKKCMEHTCMSAIYYDQGSDVKAKQCKMIITFDTIPESKILDAGDLLILSNLQKPWTIACTDNDEDVSILEEDKSQIYAHLDNVLVHMIDNQQTAIFKSNEDFNKNKEKISQYIKYAENWQVASVMCSYTAMACDVLLIIAMIVFLFKYCKTMQAMLAAFIQMNTKNTGTQLVQVNQIGRTYPPLFTLNLLKEEEIMDNLRETTTMEYVVQVIMIIVYIAIVLIIMYFCCTKCRHTRTIFKYCFPFLPISHIVHTSRCTNLFVEVTNVTKGNGIWAHFVSTKYFPSQI